MLKKNIIIKDLVLKLSLFSLKKDNFHIFKKETDNLNQKLKMNYKINYKETILKKSTLENIKIKDDCDGAILIHKNQGKLIWQNFTYR